MPSLMNPNPREFFYDSSLSERAYIKRSCFQSKAKKKKKSMEFKTVLGKAGPSEEEKVLNPN